MDEPYCLLAVGEDRDLACDLMFFEGFPNQSGVGRIIFNEENRGEFQIFGQNASWCCAGS